jgi:hypothetical protein
VFEAGSLQSARDLDNQHIDKHQELGCGHNIQSVRQPFPADPADHLAHMTQGVSHHSEVLDNSLDRLRCRLGLLSEPSHVQLLMD